MKSRLTTVLAALFTLNAILLFAGEVAYAGKYRFLAALDGLRAGMKAAELASGGKAGLAGSALKVGLVFDVGGLGDKSFNDLAYKGLKKAMDELGIAAEYLEPGEGTDRESGLRQFAAKGYDLVIGVGFIFSADIV